MPWPSAELPQRLQHREVGFPLPILLDALPPRHPHRAPDAQAGQEQIDHGRLAHPGFAADQDELAGAVGGPLEPPLQGLDFPLAAHQGSGHQRGGDLQVSSDQQPIALPFDRFEVTRRRRRVAQRRPNLLHTHPQDGVGDVRPPPDVLP